MATAKYPYILIQKLLIAKIINSYMHSGMGILFITKLSNYLSQKVSYKVKIREINNNVTAINCQSAKIKATEIKS